LHIFNILFSLVIMDLFYNSGTVYKDYKVIAYTFKFVMSIIP